MKIKEYKNELLEKAAKLAKKMEYKVWTFETSNEYINQIFIDNGITFGTISASFGGLSYATCHKQNGGTGTGFQISETCEVNKSLINSVLENKPSWAFRYNVTKESFSKYIETSILKYYEI